MRKILAFLMAFIMLMSSVPAFSEGAGLVASEKKQTATKSAKKVDYTVSLAKSPAFASGYAVFLKDARIFSNDGMTQTVGNADKGDVVVAVSRKGFNTDKARVKVTWNCDGEVKSGWVRASAIRLMTSAQSKNHVNKAKGKSGVVRTGGKYLLPIDGVKAAATAAPAPEARADLPKTAITELKTVTGGLNITWRAVEGAVRYQVFRSTKATTGFKRIANVTGATTYKDTGAKRGTAYYYKVRTVFADGNTESAIKGLYNETSPKITAKRDAATGKVTLSWKAKTGAKNYMLYRAEVGTTSYKKIATQTALTYVDKKATNGKSYNYYLVTNYTVSGKTVAATPGTRRRVNYGVKAVSKVTTSLVSAGVKIAWPKVSNATGYRVMYRVGTSGTWKKLTTTKASAAYYVHKTPAYGRVIQYTVRPEGKLNGKTVVAPGTVIATTVALKQPALKMTFADGMISMTWGAIAGAQSYELYYKHESDAEYTCVILDDTAYAVNVEAAGDYFAYVRATYTADGVTYGSRSSATASINVGEILHAPELTVVAASGMTNMLAVGWTAMEGAQSYAVEVAGDEGSQTHSYSGDTAAALIPMNEGTYSVRIRAKYAEGWSAYSPVKSVTLDWPEGIELTAPVVSATQGDVLNQANVAWTAVDGADRYVLRVQGNEVDETITLTATVATVQVNGNGTYTFTVFAEADVDADGALCTIQGPTGTAEAAFSWVGAPARVTGVTVKLSETPNYLDISWDKTASDVAYEVQLTSPDHENIEWSTEDTSITVMVNGGVDWTVRVRAYRWNDQDERLCGPWSVAKKITATWENMAAMTKPEAPTASFNAGTGNLVITYPRATGADQYYVRVQREGEEYYDGQFLTGRTYHYPISEDGVYRVWYSYTTDASAGGPESPLSDTVTFDTASVDSSSLANTVALSLSNTPNFMHVKFNYIPNTEEYELVMTSEDQTISKTINGEYSWRRDDDWIVNGGKAWTVKVRSKLKNGAYGPWSAEQTIVASWANHVSLPKLNISTRYDADSNKIVVDFDETADAQEYYLYVRSHQESEFNPDNGYSWGETLTASPYIMDLDGSEAYDYIVVARRNIKNPEGDGAWLESPCSDAATFDPADIDRNLLVPKVNLALSDTANFVDVTWQYLPMTSGYQMKYSSPSFSKTVDAYGPESRIFVNGGETLTVQVRCEFDDGAYGPWSEAKSIKGEWADQIVMVKPTVTMDINENGYVVVHYDEMPEDVYRYKLYYGREGKTQYYTTIDASNDNPVQLGGNLGTVYVAQMAAVYMVDGATYEGPRGPLFTLDTSAYIPVPQVTLGAGANTLQISWNAVEGINRYYLNYTYSGQSYQKTYSAGTTSAYIAVNEGPVEVYMKAYMGGNYSVASETKEIEADWANGIRLTAPVPVVTATEDYNYADVTWADVPGAEGYDLTYSKNGSYRYVSTPGSAKMMGNGEYEVEACCYASVITPDGDQYIYSPFETTTHTLTWSDEQARIPVFTRCERWNRNEIWAKWDAVYAATGYEVEISGPTGTETFETTAVELKHCFNGGAAYTVRLRAKFADDTYSDWNEAKTVDLTGDYTLNKPVAAAVYCDGKLIVEADSAAAQSAVEQYVVEINGQEYTAGNSGGAYFELAVDDDATYTVRVRGQRTGTSNVFYGPWSDMLEVVVPKCDETVAPVVTLSLSEDANCILVNWEQVLDTSKYVVTLTSPSVNTTKEVDKTGTGADFAVNGNEECTVTVYRVLYDGKTSVVSEPQTILAVWDDMVVVHKPTVNLSVNEDGQVVVDWDPITNDKTVYDTLITADGGVENGGTTATYKLTNQWTNPMVLTEAVGGVFTAKINASFIVNWSDGPYAYTESDLATLDTGYLVPAVTTEQTADNVLRVMWQNIECADTYTVTAVGGGLSTTVTCAVGDTDAYLALNAGAYTVTVTANLGKNTTQSEAVTAQVTGESMEKVGLTFAPSSRDGAIDFTWTNIAGSDQRHIDITHGPSMWTFDVTESTMKLYAGYGEGLYECVTYPMKKVATPDGEQLMKGPLTTVSQTMAWPDELTKTPGIVGLEIVGQNRVEVSWEYLEGVSYYDIIVTSAQGEEMYTVSASESSTTLCLNGNATYSVKMRSWLDATGTTYSYYCDAQTITLDDVQHLVLLAPACTATPVDNWVEFSFERQADIPDATYTIEMNGGEWVYDATSPATLGPFGEGEVIIKVWAEYWLSDSELLIGPATVVTVEMPAQ